MAIQVDKDFKRRCHGVTCERVIEGGELGVLKFSQQLIAEYGFDVATLVILTTFLRVLSDELLLVEGGCPRRDGGRSTGVGQADEGGLNEERALRRRQDDPKVAVLTPSVGTLNRRRICSEETMRISDGHVVRFLWMLGEGWGREAVYDGVDRQGVRHLLFFLAVDC